MTELTLQRKEITPDGVFGCLEDVEGGLQTLEHAYPQADGSYAPKVPQGRYTCLAGVHTLSSGARLYTYELLEVPGHTGILFHPGNREDDSSGCILLGKERSGVLILESQRAFTEFKEWVSDQTTFILVVQDPVKEP